MAYDKSRTFQLNIQYAYGKQRSIFATKSVNLLKLKILWIWGTVDTALQDDNVTDHYNFIRRWLSIYLRAVLICVEPVVRNGKLCHYDNLLVTTIKSREAQRVPGCGNREDW